jgi:HSP20 family protein
MAQKLHKNVKPKERVKTTQRRCEKMKLIPWMRQPHGLVTWKDQFDMLFDNFFEIDDFKGLFIPDWNPGVDISEDDKEYHLRADLPGMKNKDIRIVLKDGVMTIEGARTEESRDRGKKYSMIERKTGNFKRSFVLPEDVKPDSVMASYRKGVLDIRVPKVEKPAPKEIRIKDR